MMLSGAGAFVALLLILLVQTAAMVAIVLVAYKTSKKTSRAWDEVRQLAVEARPKFEAALENTLMLTHSLEEMGGQVKDIAAEVRTFVEMAGDTAEDVADVFQETTTRAKRQIRRVDDLVADAVDQAAETTRYLTRTVYPQMIEVAALVKGIYTTIEFLRRKRRLPTPHVNR